MKILSNKLQKTILGEKTYSIKFIKYNNIININEFYSKYMYGFFRDCKTSGSLTSELSVDGAYVLEHLSTLLEQRGLICTDREWPIFGKDDEDDSRSLTDQLLDIKPHIKSKDIKVEHSEKGSYYVYN